MGVPDRIDSQDDEEKSGHISAMRIHRRFNKEDASFCDFVRSVFKVFDAIQTMAEHLLKRIKFSFI